MAILLDSTVLQWLLLLAAATAALFAFFFSTSRKKQGLPPGPAGLPVFGSLGIFVTCSHPHQELDRLSRQYGPLMSLRLGSKQAMVVSSPELAKEVLKTFDKEFANRPPVTAKNAMFYGDYTMGFASYGPHWRFSRKVATLELLTPKRIQQLEGVRADEFSAMLSSLYEDSLKSAVVDMNQRTAHLSINIITRVLVNNKYFPYSENDGGQQKQQQPPVGNKDQKVETEFKHLIDEVFFLAGVSLIGDVIPYLGFLDKIMNYEGAMRRVHNRFDTFMRRVVEEHRQHQQQNVRQSESDFVDILLSLPGEGGVGTSVHDDNIKGLVMDVLTAGTDTSSITIEWGLSELLRHPHIMHKLQAELDSVVGTDRTVSEADIPNLIYLQAVVKEVLRLHPAGPLLIPHQNSQACQVAGYDVPAETMVIINVWSIARNPSYWDRPLDFVPERFLGRDTDVRGQHFELLPFGSGRRSCPGMHLALVMVQYGIAALVHSFDWTLPRGQGPQDLDMAEKFGLTLPRATPLHAVPTPRLPPHLYK